jgi:hypothetical protein
MDYQLALNQEEHAKRLDVLQEANGAQWQQIQSLLAGFDHFKEQFYTAAIFDIVPKTKEEKEELEGLRQQSVTIRREFRKSLISVSQANEAMMDKVDFCFETFIEASARLDKAEARVLKALGVDSTEISATQTADELSGNISPESAIATRDQKDLRVRSKTLLKQWEDNVGYYDDHPAEDAEILRRFMLLVEESIKNQDILIKSHSTEEQVAKQMAADESTAFLERLRHG